MILPFIFGYTLVVCKFTKKGFLLFRRTRGPGRAKNETNETKKLQKGFQKALKQKLSKDSNVIEESEESEESEEKTTKRKHLLYRGLGVSGLYPCPDIIVRVSCFLAILFLGVRGQK